MLANCRKAILMVAGVVVILNPPFNSSVFAYSPITGDLEYFHRIKDNVSEFRQTNQQQLDRLSDMHTQSLINEKEQDLEIKNSKDNELRQYIEAEKAKQEAQERAKREQEEKQKLIEKQKQAKAKAEETNSIIIEDLGVRGNAVISIDNIDPRYKSYRVALPPEQRDLLERLVTGEAGGSYEGSLLVAQCIRDVLVCYNYKSIEEVRQALSYTGSIERGKSENAIRAVADIFDNGINAVQHRICYFYAPGLVESQWHETQYFVIELNGHRYFDRKPDMNNNKALDKSIKVESLTEAPTEVTT